MRQLWLVLVIAMLWSTAVQAEIIFHRSDARGDDYGDGTLAYPSHEVYEAGLFDLQRFSVEIEEDDICFDFSFAAVSNPFHAPEGFFHQRLEVYIATGDSGGNEKIAVGPYQFETAPGHAWQIRLVVAPFGESKLHLAESGQVFLTGINPQLQNDGKTIRVRVNRDLLPEPTKKWSYYVLVGSFDGLALDFWRDTGDGAWQLGGSGPPIFDLLTPRWGRRSQKKQLRTGILYPVGPGFGWWAILGLLTVSGVALAAGIFVWRWISVRT